jgi:PIN domain nuclease of toxin-antitoxin system
LNGLLLDTCSAIWISDGSSLSAAARASLGDAYDAGRPCFVSAITAWEIGLLVARRRVTLSVDPLPWFQGVIGLPGFALAELSGDILIASSFLPGSPPNDPADRIILATARSRNLTIVTRDRLILRYAAEGHVKAIAC